MKTHDKYLKWKETNKAGTILKFCEWLDSEMIRAIGCSPFDFNPDIVESELDDLESKVLQLTINKKPLFAGQISEREWYILKIASHDFTNFYICKLHGIMETYISAYSFHLILKDFTLTYCNYNNVSVRSYLKVEFYAVNVNTLRNTFPTEIFN